MYILTKNSGILTKKIDWPTIALNTVGFLFIGATIAYSLVG
jgi:hypothetical protein